MVVVIHLFGFKMILNAIDSKTKTKLFTSFFFSLSATGISPIEATTNN